MPQARLAATAAISLVNRCERQAAVDAAHRALAGSSWDDLGTFWQAVLALLYAGEVDAAHEQLERVQKRSGWEVSHPHRSAVTVLRARAASLSGEPAVAARLLSDALRRGVFPQFTEVAVAWAVLALADLGELERGENLLFAFGFGHAIEKASDRAEILAARGVLREAAGRQQSAYEDFTAAGRVLVEWGVTNPAVIGWRSQAALCAAATERRSLARSLADDELLQARRWGTSHAIGSSLRAAALVSEDGRDIEMLTAAIGHLRRARARGTLLRTSYELGLKSALAGRVEESRAALEEARETARYLGSRVWVDRVDEASRRWVVTSAGKRLTTREREVLSLAQVGLGNREVAERLRLANSTVEFHLSNIYRKLGISGRNELRSILFPVSTDQTPRSVGDREDPPART
ncbi:helix-turn-helix transcriptional regulator [Amycolatopsis sp. lyj-90]|uniref:helix-turn-helix transcriptional regulator n=1 Tax=Amycolatopsis sp. lyj-90 TaxID=2789285 RepID=UPI00397ADB3E